MTSLTELDPKELLEATTRDFLSFLGKISTLSKASTSEERAFSRDNTWSDLALASLRDGAWNDADQYECFLTQFAFVKTVTQVIDFRLADRPEELKKLQAWFRQETDRYFQ